MGLTGRVKRERRLIEAVTGEFDSAELGDTRRNDRLEKIVEQACRSPEESFPRQAGSPAALEGIYRFLSNDAITPSALFAPHAGQTCERVTELGTALVAHDRSEFEAPDEAPRAGLGPLANHAQGFLGQISLAIAADGSQRPLGTLSVKTWVRTPDTRRRVKKQGKRTQRKRDALYHSDKESHYWREAIEACEARVAGRGSLVHLIDREGDIFELLTFLVQGSLRFVIRLGQERCAESADGEIVLLSEALAHAETLHTMDVVASKREEDKRPGRSKSLAPRDRRLATVSIRASRVVVMKPVNSSLERAGAPSVEINIVSAVEVNPPEGEQPIHWRLATTESISTLEDVLKIVSFYKNRWLIEEFFKALKTGCAFKERQLESYDALVRALMIFLPLAWQLLLMRCLAGMNDDSPARAALTADQIAVLQAHKKTRLKRSPTVRDALLAVAQLGGFWPGNGRPGWRILSRGMEVLALLTTGWLLGAEAQPRPRRCD